MNSIYVKDKYHFLFKAEMLIFDGGDYHFFLFLHFILINRRRHVKY